MKEEKQTEEVKEAYRRIGRTQTPSIPSSLSPSASPSSLLQSSLLLSSLC